MVLTLLKCILRCGLDDNFMPKSQRHRSDGEFYIKVLENKEIPVEYLLHFIERAKEYISNNTHYLDDVYYNIEFHNNLKIRKRRWQIDTKS